MPCAFPRIGGVQRSNRLEDLANASIELGIRTAEEQTRGFGRLSVRAHSTQRQLYGPCLARREKAVQHVCIACESFEVIVEMPVDAHGVRNKWMIDNSGGKRAFRAPLDNQGRIGQPLCLEPAIQVDVALAVRPEDGQALHFLAKYLLGKI